MSARAPQVSEGAAAHPPRVLEVAVLPIPYYQPETSRGIVGQVVLVRTASSGSATEERHDTLSASATATLRPQYAFGAQQHEVLKPQLIVGPEDFELVSGREDLATYEFNTRAAKHHFRRTSGMHPFYVPRSDPDKFDVNVRCLEALTLEASTSPRSTAVLHPEIFDTLATGKPSP